MKIFNATNSMLDLPYGSMNRLRVEPRSFSQEFMGTSEFIQTLVMSYNTEEVAILVGGPYELGMCASVPVSVGYVCQTTDEIVQRFGLKKEKKEVKMPPISKPKPEPEIPVVEEESSEDAEEPEPTPVPEPEKPVEEEPKTDKTKVVDEPVEEKKEYTEVPAPAPKKKRTTKKKTSE